MFYANDTLPCEVFPYILGDFMWFLKSLDGCIYFVKGKLKKFFFYKVYKKIIVEFLKDVVVLHVLYTVRANVE